MSELTISAAGFTIQPLVNQPDGVAVELRWWYNRSFLSSEGIQVNWGTGKQGFWVTTPCTIASGLIDVSQDTLLWTTDNAQDPAPLSLGISAGIFVNNKMVQQLQIANKSQWTVPSSLTPTTTWENFSTYNQAVTLYYYNPNFYNAPQVDAVVDRAFDEHPATTTDLGSVRLSTAATIATDPVVWGQNDALVRDAIKLQGKNVDDAAPVDGQILGFNAAANEWQPSTPGFGTGNVLSNEIVSVDSELTLFSGTGGKTIKRGNQTGVLRADSGVVSVDTDVVTSAAALTANAFVVGDDGAQAVETITATQATALLNNVVGDSGAGGTKGLAPAPAAGDAAAGKFLKADATWAAPSGTGAPSDATYITQTANGGLSAEQALSTLSTGLMRVATTTGVITSITDSAGVAANISDETGTGALVFGTGPTITSPLISLTAAHGSDDTYTGLTIAGLNAGATIAQWETVYLGGSSTWLLADANGASTYPARGLAVASYVDTNPAIILTYGTVRNDAWNWTIAGLIYLSATPGALTQTAPSTSGDQVQVVGYALTADIAFFDFNSTYLTVA